MVKIFQTLRNHWKKSVFFAGLTIWGTKFAHGKYLEFNLMKAYCQESLKYGEEKIGPFGNPRHVTVLLNPVANDRKGKNDYEKYCAPLFHLAGIRVSLVTTEAEGQVKELMEIMDNTDCVVLAGGDGTVHEALTGLFRRKDSLDAIKRFPIGILPIGKNNSIAYRLNSDMYDASKDMKAKILAESSMAIIRQTLNKVDVMKIEGKRGRPVYSLGFLNMGQIQNVIQKVDQYWYLGKSMRPYLAFFFQSFKDLADKWNDNEEILIEYTEPCTGCSKCFNRFDFLQQVATNNDQKGTPVRWWYSFFRRPDKPLIDPVLEENKRTIEKMKNTNNDNCDQWQALSVKCKDIIINDTFDNALEMIIYPNNLHRTEFISEGVQMFKKQRSEKNSKTITIKAKDLRIHSFEDNCDQSEDVKYSGPVKFNEQDGNLNNSSFSLVQEIEHRPNSIRELDDKNDEYLRNNHISIPPESILDTDEQSKNVKEESIVDNIENEDKNEYNSDDNSKWIGIDNENYEIQSLIEISLLPKSVQIYYGRTENENTTMNNMKT